ncbi:hypothetical protein PCS_00104 [Desulfocurvibacter africanus PCS]|uniref:Lipoprotein n=1 Tax=Desulfocurvibacter africanus PCS TaxID=1262666 RepID=M5PXS0_DESAF|nr:hypothetical protein [Desulfocurvibacter africanus]EMG39097.1 hypothetical protein PCS_00104 [Desulfocurvibacter africanus PCS]
MKLFLFTIYVLLVGLSACSHKTMNSYNPPQPRQVASGIIVQADQAKVFSMIRNYAQSRFYVLDETRADKGLLSFSVGVSNIAQYVDCGSRTAGYGGRFSSLKTSTSQAAAERYSLKYIDMEANKVVTEAVENGYNIKVGIICTPVEGGTLVDVNAQYTITGRKTIRARFKRTIATDYEVAFNSKTQPGVGGGMTCYSLGILEKDVLDWITLHIKGAVANS